jgi:hypothetical protein
MVEAAPEAGCVIKDATGGRSAPGYLIEFQAIGNSAKVSAVDPDTGLEVSIVGPIGAGRETLARNAVAKLERMLKQRADRPKRT